MLLHTYLYRLDWKQYKDMVKKIVFNFYRHFNALKILDVVRIFNCRKLRIYICLEIFVCSIFLMIFGNRFRNFSIFILTSIKSVELLNFIFNLHKNRLFDLFNFPFKNEANFALTYLMKDIYAFSAAALLLGFIFMLCIKFILKYSKFYGSFLVILIAYFYQIYRSVDLYTEVVFYLLVFIISHVLFRFIEHMFFIKLTILSGLILFVDTSRLLLKLLFTDFQFHQRITVEYLVGEKFKMFLILFSILMVLQMIVGWKFLRRK